MTLQLASVSGRSGTLDPFGTRTIRAYLFALTTIVVVAVTRR
jgi:hypothetical protein